LNVFVLRSGAPDFVGEEVGEADADREAEAG